MDNETGTWLGGAILFGIVLLLAVALWSVL